MLAFRAAAAALVVAAAAESDYNYGDIVSKYCHPELDWGELPGPPDGATGLKQVQVFVRHGARTMASAGYCWEGGDDPAHGTFSCELSYLDNSVDSTNKELTEFFRKRFMPSKNGIWGTCEIGQLVRTGFEMEYNNGRRLREAYVDREHFLPPSLTEMDNEALDQDFFIRSTNTPRTRQSGMAVFTGMYGSDNKLDVPYITMRTTNKLLENMFPNQHICPSLATAEENFYASSPKTAEALRLCGKYGDPGKLLTPKECNRWLAHLIDCLMSRMCPTVPFSTHNETVPKDFFGETDGVQDIWKFYDSYQYDLFKALQEGGSVSAFVSDILGAAEKAESGSAEMAKFVLYSGHDTGPMLPLYTAFDLHPEPPFWPTFASMIVLELWDSPDGTIVRWISNGKVVGRPMAFDEFRRQAEALVAKGTQCKETGVATAASSLISESVSATVFSAGWFTSNGTAVAITVAVACAALLALAGVTVAVVRRRRSRRPVRLEEGVQEPGFDLGLDGGSSSSEG